MNQLQLLREYAREVVGCDPELLVGAKLGREVKSAEMAMEDLRRRRHIESVKRLRKKYARLGLTQNGRPRKNRDLNGLSKDHTAYMRAYRDEKYTARGLRRDGGKFQEKHEQIQTTHTRPS